MGIELKFVPKTMELVSPLYIESQDQNIQAAC